jgi:hypothetical protein
MFDVCCVLGGPPVASENAPSRGGGGIGLDVREGTLEGVAECESLLLMPFQKESWRILDGLGACELEPAFEVCWP